MLGREIEGNHRRSPRRRNNQAIWPSVVLASILGVTTVATNFRDAQLLERDEAADAQRHAAFQKAFNRLGTTPEYQSRIEEVLVRQGGDCERAHEGLNLTHEANVAIQGECVAVMIALNITHDANGKISHYDDLSIP